MSEQSKEKQANEQAKAQNLFLNGEKTKRSMKKIKKISRIKNRKIK